MFTKKNILVLTSVYPANDMPKSDTPIVHYFTKEWVKMGHNVRVVHYVTNFPSLLYKLVKPLKEIISAHVGFEIRTIPYNDYEYIIDNVIVKRITLKKLKPHALYSQKEICCSFTKTIDFCKNNKFIPDVIIAHWANPMLEIISKLKDTYNIPICYIAHGINEANVFKTKTEELLSNLDVIGFRSDTIKRLFLEQHPLTIPSFLCYSGIPEHYIPISIKKDLHNISKYIYIGTLIKRKYPDVIIRALKESYGNNNFSMTYIGEGNEIKSIKKVSIECNVSKNIKLLGRISRDDVFKQLDDSQVFIMISRKETYGLVYLEAMARGCLTIASRNEGFDGIIKDNVNGFLCNAGNHKELSQIITKIRNMSLEEKQFISSNAIKTAKNLTDEKVARLYLNSIFNCKK